MTITALPTPPSNTDSPANFAIKAGAFVAALPQLVTQINAEVTTTIPAIVNTVAGAAETATGTTIPGHVSAVSTSRNTAVNTTIPGIVSAVDARKIQAVNIDIPGILDTLRVFNARGAWATATAYALRDVYTSSGIAYVVLTAHTSTSVAADLAAGKVGVHQGATAEDLANKTDPAKGAAMIGYDSTTVKAMLDSVSIINAHALHAAHDGFRKLEAAGGPHYVGITGYGDSMAGGYMVNTLVRAMQLRYGLGGVFTPGFGQAGLSGAWAFTGGAAQPRNDFTYLPGANQVTMPAGATAQTSSGGVNLSSAEILDGAYPLEMNDDIGNTIGIQKVRCFYLKRPGDGSLTFTISQAGVTGYSPVVVDCNAALALAFVDITVLDTSVSVTLHVAASSAACIFIGGVFLRDTGILWWHSQVGGTTMDQQKPYITNGNAATIYAPLCAALSTALVIHAQRVPGDASWQTNYPDVFNSLAALPGVSQFVLGEPPRTIEDTPTVPVINAFLRNQCLLRGYAYFDQYKAMGSSSAVLTTLGWGDGDGVHLDAPAHRFLAGKILAAVDWFRLGGNKLDVAPLTLPRLYKSRMRFLASDDVSSYTISGRGVDVMEGVVTSGGFTATASNGQGFILTSAAALGAVTGRPGVIPMSVSVETKSSDLTVAFVGYRNLNIPAGVRAFILCGVTSSFSSITALNQRCFGVEFARGSDVGSPDSGVTDEVFRLLTCDGTTTTYGSWRRVSGVGVGQTSQTGAKFFIRWSLAAQKLELFRHSGRVVQPASSLNAPHLAVNACAGQYVNLCLLAEDAGNVPVAAGNMSFLEIKSKWSIDVFGVLNSNPYGA